MSAQEQTAAQLLMNMTAEMVAAERRRHADATRLTRRVRESSSQLADAIARFGGRLSAWDQKTLYWVVDVDSFASALPLIEFAESFAGECEGSADWPAYRQRDFLFAWLRIACTLKDDSDSCRVVVKGFKEPEPILEFVCTEAA